MLTQYECHGWTHLPCTPKTTMVKSKAPSSQTSSPQENWLDSHLSQKLLPPDPAVNHASPSYVVRFLWAPFAARALGTDGKLQMHGWFCTGTMWFPVRVAHQCLLTLPLRCRGRACRLVQGNLQPSQGLRCQTIWQGVNHLPSKASPIVAVSPDQLPGLPA